MITGSQIEAAKRRCRYHRTEPYHEHPSGVRAAYAWLMAQHRGKGYPPPPADLKHIIECWARCYVSAGDVDVAASLAGLHGRYPYFNIQQPYVQPSLRLLDDLDRASMHYDGDPDRYRFVYRVKTQKPASMRNNQHANDDSHR